MILVRIHDCPIGMTSVTFREDGIGAAALEREILAHLGAELDRHLSLDGISGGGPIAARTEAADDGPPKCQLGRRAVLANPLPVSVVIATRDRAVPLERCVASVLACEYPRERLEVIVVDNAPSDSRTRDVVAAASRADDRVKYVLSARPGASSARNEGATRGGGEIVAVIDDDAVADRYWIAELVRGFDAAPASDA